MRKMVIAVTMLALVLVPTMVFAADSAEVTVNVSVAEWAGITADTPTVGLELKDDQGWHLAGADVTVNSNSAVDVKVRGHAEKENWDAANMYANTKLELLANSTQLGAENTFVAWPAAGNWYDGLIGEGKRAEFFKWEQYGGTYWGIETAKADNPLSLGLSITGRETIHNIIAISVKPNKPMPPTNAEAGAVTLTFTISPQ